MPPERGFWECFIASKSSGFSSVSLAKPSRSTKSTARSCVVVIEDSILPLLANAGPLYWRSDKLTGSRIYRLSVRVDWSSICNGNLLFSFYSVKSHFQKAMLHPCPLFAKKIGRRTNRGLARNTPKTDDFYGYSRASSPLLPISWEFHQDQHLDFGP